MNRRGKPVVALTSDRQLETLQSDRPRFVDTYRAFLRKHPLNAIDVDSAVFQIARAKSAGREVEDWAKPGRRQS